MKIITNQEFLAKPSGILFAKYRPQNFGSLCIKGDTFGGNDFTYCEAVFGFDCTDDLDHFEVLDQAEKNGTSVPMAFQQYQRDSMCDANQLYAVFERDDLVEFVAGLQDLLPAHN